MPVRLKTAWVCLETKSCTSAIICLVDVHASKAQLRWRTALILREMEAELEALDAFEEKEARLVELMAEKEVLEAELAGLYLRKLRGGGQPSGNAEGD